MSDLAIRISGLTKPELESRAGDPDTQDQELLLIRSRLLYLRRKEIYATARQLEPVLAGQIASNDISLYTMLYLASEPEVVEKIAENVRDVNRLIQHYREEAIAIGVFKLIKPYNRLTYRDNFDDHQARNYYAKQAARYGHDDVLEAILKREKDGFRLNQEYRFYVGRVLEAAAKGGQLSCLKLIFSYFRVTELNYQNCDQVMGGLLEGTRIVEPKTPRERANFVTNFPHIDPSQLNRALAHAAGNNDIQMVNFLLDQGANPTYLGMCKSKTHVEMIRYFMELAKPSDQELLQVMAHALDNGCEEGFELLRQKYPFKVRLNCTALIRPAIHGNLYNMFRLLMDERGRLLKDYDPIADKLTLSHLMLHIITLDRVDFVVPFLEGAVSTEKVNGEEDIHCQPGLTWREQMRYYVHHELKYGERLYKPGSIHEGACQIEMVTLSYKPEHWIVSHLVQRLNMSQSGGSNSDISVLSLLAYAPPVVETKPFYYTTMQAWAQRTTDPELREILARKGVVI